MRRNDDIEREKEQIETDLLALLDGRKRLCELEAFAWEMHQEGVIAEEKFLRLRAALDTVIEALKAGQHQGRQNLAVPIAERIEWQAEGIGQPDLFGNSKLTSSN